MIDIHVWLIDQQNRVRKYFIHTDTIAARNYWPQNPPPKNVSKNVSKNLAQYIYYKWLISVSEFVSMMEKPSTTSNNTWWCLPTKSTWLEPWKDYIVLVRRIGSFKSSDGKVKGTSRSKHTKSQVCLELYLSFKKKRLLKFLYSCSWYYH